ncbi:flagellin [Pseudooceanicola sediminis]|uniref:Flagellin n=1 Tax=Pseudooceanicola sediminis TaxID=2211117 RepID=A0A399J4H5_9RHOB|nr:flagellin [Pseudooceanicola sediminis]KAA2315564.1 flagellin [Puniceibacterium sp. HSS470]RII40234.1 flagellin [Pseudooceanicola sediminis]|tara:strand:- start:20046 stop:21320 length:1275 start_codon:yes stop_codon:yes gene_type:complete
MSSILTNNSAMVALQTLKSVNKSMVGIQGQISTGMKVASAKDNSAVWAISKVMESDVKGFKGISESLALGESTVAVARQASETVTDLLTQMKGKIVASQEENVDREKIQADVDALRGQIGTVVSAAQFNGLNLLSNAEKTAGSGTVNILSSLDRSTSGVAVSQIAVGKQDLGTTASAITGTAIATATNNLTGAADAAASALTGAATPPTSALTVTGVEAGFGYSLAITAGAGNYAAVATGGLNDISYVARDGDTVTDVAAGLAKAFNAYVAEEMGDDVSTVAATSAAGVVTFTGSSVTGDNFSITANGYAAAGNTIGGGLSAVTDIDITSDSGAASALTEIETLIQTSIDAAASFGSVQSRIETQSDFIGTLTDSLKSGIGTLVDANMEEASARLQALQVQQQLAVQAMSIANQAPQTLLSLFR